MTQDTSSLGQDSFLDIVANLVGILIILVVIIGAQAANVWQRNDQETTELQAELQELRRENEQRKNESVNLRLEHDELERKIEQEQSVTAQLEQIRHRLLVDMEAARRVIGVRKSELDENRRSNVAASVKIDSLKQALQHVRYEIDAVENQTQPIVEKIEHFPTPIARTVFSDEVHFRLTRGRIVHVPLEELVGAMQNEWQVKARKLANAENTWETVGPIDDFRLQYALTAITDRFDPSRRGVQLKRFVLQPVRENIGEKIDDALRQGSKFRDSMRRLVPQKTTVSLWVYPDAYEHLAVVRTWLRENGFQTASWPLEYGGLISGGPNGFRTTTN